MPPPPLAGVDDVVAGNGVDGYRRCYDAGEFMLRSSRGAAATLVNLLGAGTPSRPHIHHRERWCPAGR